MKKQVAHKKINIMINILYQVAKELQKTMEETLDGHTVGRCYLTGHCLAKIFERLAYFYSMSFGTFHLGCYDFQNTILECGFNF